MEIIYLILGIAIGAVASWLIARSKSLGLSKAAAEKSSYMQQLIDELKQEVNKKDNTLFAISSQLSIKETELKYRFA
jgi:gas vesicle protein